MDVILLSLFAAAVLAARYYAGREAARFFDALPEAERERIAQRYIRCTY